MFFIHDCCVIFIKYDDDYDDDDDDDDELHFSRLRPYSRRGPEHYIFGLSVHLCVRRVKAFSDRLLVVM